MTVTVQFDTQALGLSAFSLSTKVPGYLPFFRVPEVQSTQSLGTSECKYPRSGYFKFKYPKSTQVPMRHPALVATLVGDPSSYELLGATRVLLGQ